MHFPGSERQCRYIRCVRELDARIEEPAVLPVGKPGRALRSGFSWSVAFLAWSTIPGSTPTSPKNWLQHGIYGITNSGVIMPTLSRLPGYPAFLAVIFALFGDRQFSSCTADRTGAH